MGINSDGGGGVRYLPAGEAPDWDDHFVEPLIVISDTNANRDNKNRKERWERRSRVSCVTRICGEGEVKQSLLDAA